jgi:hypothetical protein
MMPNTANTPVKPAARCPINEQALAALGLEPWVVRLVVYAHRLRESGKSSMMTVRFDGPAMTLFKLTPDGRIEV